MYRYAIFLTLGFCFAAAQSRALFAETMPASDRATAAALSSDSDGSDDLATGATDVDGISNLSPAERATVVDMIRESHGEPQRSPAIVEAGSDSDSDE
jgi:hypothetical protein